MTLRELTFLLYRYFIKWLGELGLRLHSDWFNGILSTCRTLPVVEAGREKTCQFWQQEGSHTLPGRDETSFNMFP